jgi:long-chain fatty acid transport protein
MQEGFVNVSSPGSTKLKRLLLTFSSVLFASISLAGGLVTNTNQSASWVRLPSRNASTGIDAAYYNPAGLTKLNDGFHFSLSGQTVIQRMEVENSYSGIGGKYRLNNSIYRGYSYDVFSPSVYAVYKIKRFAFALGYNTLRGTGTEIFEKGLPSFELDQPDIIPFLPASYGVTAYNSDLYLRSKSTVKGYQAGISLKVNKIISVGVGIRLSDSKSKYRGHIRDIKVNSDFFIWNRTDQVMNAIAAIANDAFTGRSENRGTTELITAGVGSFTFAQVQGIYITPARRAELEAALSSFGYPANTLISTADNIFRAVEGKYSTAAQLYGDKFINSLSEGKGITQVFSINISPSDNINVALRYETRTRLELKNKSTGRLIRNDMPAMLAFGIDYSVSKNLRFSAGADYFFDKSAEYTHIVFNDLVSGTTAPYIPNLEIIDRNGISLQAGLEYQITNKIKSSCGVTILNNRVNEKYQSDIDFNLSSRTIGFGGEYSVNKLIKLNLGASYSFYKEDSKTISHTVIWSGDNINAKESYNKNRLIIAAGLDFSF